MQVTFRGITEGPELRLAGMHRTMSLADNQTGQLWQSFMQCCMQQQIFRGQVRYSLQQYPADYQFQPPDAGRLFEKWACMEASEETKGVLTETLTLPGGDYAVFDYTGSSAAGAELFGWIFGQWFPSSGWKPDAGRPHYEVLGPDYKPNDPASREEIWIPVFK